MPAFVRYAAPLMLALSGMVLAADYDPAVKLVEPRPGVNLEFTDAARKREIPLRVYLPTESNKPVPVVLFSHGLGGSRENLPYLGQHWSARGYAAVFVQHSGSDESVWKDQPLGKRMAALQQAAGAQNFLLRVKDIPAVLDQLDRWNQQAGHAFAGKFDLTKVGMSGHSFGAVTTQAVSGQQFGRGLFVSYTEPRIKAAIAFSPSSPRAGDVKQAFGSVKIPWLLMTGTHDVSPIGEQSAESRLEVYPALPPGGKYELVFDKAEHSFVSDRALPGEKLKRNPNHQPAISAITTAFWDAYLLDNSAAKTWLDGPAPKKLLEKDDRWQLK